MHARLTREGAWFGALLAGVLLAAVNTGNNLTYVVLALLCATLVVSNALAEWNLRGLSVRRRLPAEVFAREGAPGSFVVENRRRWGAAWALDLEERLVDEAGDTIAVARAAVAHVQPGRSVECPTRWVLAQRGEVGLAHIRVASSYPFGLIRRWRDEVVPATLLVYPAPAPGTAARPVPGVGAVRHDRRRGGREGEFRGLREYVAGDPMRDIHWPTTARTGAPTVVVRTASVSDEVMVEVDEAVGARWEAALERACGEVVRHFRQGHAVGLRLGGRTLGPRTGETWRRQLLDLLALAPRRA